MTRFALIVLMALAGQAGQAAAQDAYCANAMVQADLNECAAAEWQAADELLNQRYKEAMKLLQTWDSDLPEALKGGPADLRAAQRAWITYRDAACSAEGYAMRGGSAEPLLVYGCKARLTEARTEDLEGLIEYGEH